MSNLNIKSDSAEKSRRNLIAVLDNEAYPMPNQVLLHARKLGMVMAHSPELEKAIIAYLSNFSREMRDDG